MNAAINIDENGVKLPQQKLADWLWHPWYAKIWWATIPVWWAGMAASTRFLSLAAFYESALAGFLNILFFPMTAIMVLGVGYAQHLLGRRPICGDGNGVELLNVDLDPFGDEVDGRKFGHPHPSVDMYHPRSGGLYIGSPESLQHPDRH
ncbi:hypothetical protein [Sphingobium cupriresistens]|uniref:hypothetical protein n=1 Tax=Sphingobium cupriresistens TaxID=1132417 RepID=UPI003BF5951A